MARKQSFATQIAKAQKEAEREAQRQKREAERLARERAAAKVRAEKEARQAYLDSRAQKVEEDNLNLQSRVNNLTSILAFTLSVDDTITFDSLKPARPALPAFQPPASLNSPAPEPRLTDFTSQVKTPGFFAKIFDSDWETKHQEKLDEAQAEYTKAKESFDDAERQRLAQIATLKQQHEEQERAALAHFEEELATVEDFRNAYNAGDPESIIEYNRMVLERSLYPDSFPQTFRVAWTPESRELVVEYELPHTNVIPNVAEYKYIRTRDTIDTRLRKPAEIKALYQDILVSITLRTLHELFEADQAGHIAVLTFNGFVTAIAPDTGCVLDDRAQARLVQLATAAGQLLALDTPVAAGGVAGLAGDQLAAFAHAADGGLVASQHPRHLPHRVVAAMCLRHDDVFVVRSTSAHFFAFCRDDDR